MPPNTGKHSRLTFQEIARRLPPDKLRRLEEINKAYAHIPLDLLPEQVRPEVQDILRSRINTPAAPQVHATQSTIYSVIGTDIENNKDVVVYQQDRTQVLYIIGTTGTGKSTLLANLILADIEQGLGSALLSRMGI